MALKNNLPAFVANEKYTSEILNALEFELDKIKLRINEMLLECCVTTCTNEGITRFEKDYSVSHNANLTLDERKKRVINKMLSKKRLTKEELSDFIKRNINNTQYYITNMAEQYKFQVRLSDENHKENLYDALFNVRPANLIFEVILVSYEKRCGTFKCSEQTI